MLRRPQKKYTDNVIHILSRLSYMLTELVVQQQIEYNLTNNRHIDSQSLAFPECFHRPAGGALIATSWFGMCYFGMLVHTFTFCTK